MAKRKTRAKGRKSKGNGKAEIDATIGRRRTFPSNGDQPSSTEVLPETVSIGEAMRQAVEALGETSIDPELAPAHLRRAAELYDEFTRRKAAFEKKHEEAKTAKKSMDGAVEMILLHIQECTHTAPLPLFDAKQAEADRASMLESDDDDVVAN